MKVTSIQAQKRNQDRVSVFLDDKFWTGMSQTLLIRTGLAPGQEINDKRKAEIESEVVADSALSYAIARISRVMTSEQTLRRKLRERDYGEDVQDAVIDELKRLALINDDLMVETICRDALARHRGAEWAKRKIAEKGLAVNLDLLARMFPEQTERQRALEALDSIIGGKQLDVRAARRRLSTLISRGFSYESASFAVGERSFSEEEEAALHDADEARELITRKYGEIDSHRTRSKAWAFLKRRGFVTSVIEEALRPDL